MQEIYNIDNVSVLSELHNFPNQGILWEILNTNKTGKIFALSDNAIMVVENSINPFIFIAGNLIDKDIDNVVNFLKDHDFPRINCSPQYHHLFLKHNYNFHLRCEFKMTRASENTLGSNLDIRQIDNASIFRKCSKYENLCQHYGSEQNFLDLGTGYALLIEDQIVSEVYASIGNGYGEISIKTHKDHQRKGHASRVVSHLMNELNKRNIIPIWSRDVDNRASFHTAIKLGFEPNLYYVQLVPDFGNVLCENLGTWIENNSYQALYNN